ncbi:MAG TPA: site-2 protease family protein [Candidatus Limnocylindrales bacterium]
MSQQTVFALVAVAIIILVSFPVHEFTHAFAAFKLGDSTARWQGRLTLNPIVHFDPLGGAILVVSALLGGFFIGWAKPTPVNPYNLRYGRRGEAIVSAAGPLSNLVLAAAIAIPVRVAWGTVDSVSTPLATPIAAAIYDVAFYFVLVNGFLFLFNLLPIPPLDGWRVLLGLVDARTSYNLRQFEQYGFVLLLVIVLFGASFLAPLAGEIKNLLLGNALLISV